MIMLRTRLRYVLHDPFDIIFCDRDFECNLDTLRLSMSFRGAYLDDMRAKPMPWLCFAGVQSVFDLHPLFFAIVVQM